MDFSGRLDRQLRITGWDQEALERTPVAVVGDHDRLASLFVLAAAALGLKRLVLVAPWWDEALLAAAAQLNPGLQLAAVEGYYLHPAQDAWFRDCRVWVDLSRYGLATKLLFDRGCREGRPGLRGFCETGAGVSGLVVYTYLPGQEGPELERVVTPRNLPGPPAGDPVPELIAAGLVLEELKNLVMGGTGSGKLFTYRREEVRRGERSPAILVVGAGALGNFAGWGLLAAGLTDLTVMDPDVIEVTNLNRQVFFAGAVGRPKAQVLAERLNGLFGVNTAARTEYFGVETDIGAYDLVVDGVDNFETRLVLSEACRAAGKRLVSGGSSAQAGQVIVYDPRQGGPTPAELLGLAEIVAGRPSGPYRRERAACVYDPEPSVIMSNMIVGGLMADAARQLLGGGTPENIFYESGKGIRSE